MVEWLGTDGCKSKHPKHGCICSEEPVENFSCYKPGSEAQEEINIIDVGRYGRCGNRHECIIQGDSENSLRVDALSWLAEGVGKGARHIYSCYHKYRY